MDEQKNLCVAAVIPAAGHGSRMKAGINKQYLTLKGKPILSYTLDVFEADPLIDEIVLVINPFEKAICEKEVLKPGKYKKIKLADGGATRQESVFSGLKACSADTDIVLIHDGARPMISDSLLRECITETVKHHATVVAVPAKNTIKVIGKDGFVDHTPDRSTLYEIQTPQSFEYHLIMDAYTRAEVEGFTGSDDASLAEHYDYPVKVIRGKYSNLKITTPEDLIIGESIIQLKLY